MLKKVQKYIDLAQSVINQKNSISELKSYNNPTLNKVLDTIFQVKNSNFGDEDLAVFEQNKSYKNELSKNNQVITYEIFNSDLKRTVQEISSIAASPEIWGKFHYFIAKNLSAKNYLEIGTNLGISGSYILSALKKNPESNFVTMEGLESLCEISRKQFLKISDEKNFQIIQGLYENTFDQVLDLPFDFDVIFIDGNHQKDPTLHYFNSLKSKINSPAVIVFDDINWNVGMQEAWEIIRNERDVSYALDLYKLGIVIIDKNDKNKSVNKKLFLTLK